MHYLHLTLILLPILSLQITSIIILKIQIEIYIVNDLNNTLIKCIVYLNWYLYASICKCYAANLYVNYLPYSKFTSTLEEGGAHPHYCNNRWPYIKDIKCAEFHLFNCILLYSECIWLSCTHIGYLLVLA